MTKRRTVRMAPWNYEGKTRREIFDEHKLISETRDESAAATLEIFDLSDDNAGRVGYMIQESDGEKTYKVIYAFTIADNQLLQSAIYFDNDTDKNWALNTWRTLRFD